MNHEGMRPMGWWHEPDQRLIDGTLDERLQEVQRVQAAIYCATDREEYRMYQRAWFHIAADIAVLQPQSSVPF